MPRMLDLRGIMELCILFKFKFQFTILFILILLLGNKTCRCAPVTNSTFGLPMDKTDVKYLIQIYEIQQENITLTNSSDELVVNLKHDDLAGSASVPDFIPGVNSTERQSKEVQDILTSREDAIAHSASIASELTMSDGILSTNNYEETERSISTISHSMAENTITPPDVIDKRDTELKLWVRENNGIDNSNSNQIPTIKQVAQKTPRNHPKTFSENASEESPRHHPKTFSKNTSDESPRHHPTAFSEIISDESPRHHPTTFSENTSEKSPRHHPTTFSENTSEKSPRQHPTTFSDPSSSQTAQSGTFPENTKQSSPPVGPISLQISLPSKIPNVPNGVENTANEDISTSTDNSIPKQGSTVKSDVASDKTPSDSFPTTYVPSTSQSLQTSHSPKPEHVVGNTEYDDDEYVDQLHQALVSYGLSDSFSQDEDIEYQPLVVSDEPLKDFTSGGTQISSNESESRDMTPSTKSAGNLKEGPTVDVDMAVKSQEDKKEAVGVKVDSQEKTPRDDTGENFVQNDEHWAKQKSATARNVIELPNGVVIDALFDSIDSLQDQLDICEEGIRQRLVVHKDIFFGNSQSLAETDEEVELPTDELAEDAFSPIIPNDRDYQQGLTQTQSNKPTASGAKYITHTTTKHAMDDEEDTDDDEKDDMTTDAKPGNNYHRPLNTKWTLSHGNNEADDKNDNVYLLTNSMSLQVDTGVNDDEKEADKAKGPKLNQEKVGQMEGSDHMTNDAKSYYTSVARSVIQRLSKRLRYLEVSIKECNHLTHSMTRHKSPP